MDVPKGLAMTSKNDKAFEETLDEAEVKYRKALIAEARLLELMNSPGAWMIEDRHLERSDDGEEE